MEETKLASRWSDIVAITPIIISCIAVVFTAISIRIQQRHNIKSVKPIGKITIDVGRTSFSIYIENFGLGPMIIDSFIYKLKDKHSYSIIDFIHYSSDVKVNFTDHLCDVAIASNSKKCIFSLNASTEKRFQDIIELFTGLQIHVIYKDIYDNTFKIENEYSSFKGLSQL